MMRRQLLTLVVILQRCVGTTEYGACESDNDTCQAAPVASVGCGVWLAESTLTGTGIGMFAGKKFTKGDSMMPAGDHVIPIVDVVIYNEQGFFFLWDDYTWDAQHMGANGLGILEVNIASPGFGAAANSFMDFVNVNEGIPTLSAAQDLHRSKDPGAGAFTYYHSRMSTASKNIQPGQELFVSYGNNWFQTRTDLGAIPILGDHQKAGMLYKKFQMRFMKKGVEKTPTFMALQDMWETFVVNDIWGSRVLAALPPKKDYEKMQKIGLVKTKESQMARSENWFEKHGVCADHLHLDVSTIPQAGNGAFASRSLPQGSAILPVPLIHIPDRSVLDMREVADSAARQIPTDSSKVVRRQLLLNYCLGHANSTMLLSPYGPVFNLINHNQTSANVRLVWALPERSNHHLEMLEKHPSHLEDIKGATVAMELVSLRDIHQGEEIFLDYGDEWEKAWQEHVRNWKPVKGAGDYLSAAELNTREERLRTEFEQMKDPYPGNMGLKFDRRFEDFQRWKGILRNGGSFEKLKEGSNALYVDCEILRFKESKGRVYYTAVIPDNDESTEYKVIKEAPREAFMFQDRPYTSDMFLNNAFRHEIRIPDAIFPEAWKNAK